jgi:hypothetical protein
MDTFILLSMIFLHIVDDYKLQQGLLVNLKQKSFWKEYIEKDSKYKFDYIVALIMHSFSWSFMIMLPIAFVFNFQISLLFVIAFVLNLIIHAIVDNLKANKFKINLIVDQSIHIIQIVITFLILFVL